MFLKPSTVPFIEIKIQNEVACALYWYILICSNKVACAYWSHIKCPSINLLQQKVACAFWSHLAHHADCRIWSSDVVRFCFVSIVCKHFSNTLSPTTWETIFGHSKVDFLPMRFSQMECNGQIFRSGFCLCSYRPIDLLQQSGYYWVANLVAL